jgi:hypothetical protein
MVVIPAQAGILMQPAIPTKALRLPVELAMTIIRTVIKPPMYLQNSRKPVPISGKAILQRSLMRFCVRQRML